MKKISIILTVILLFSLVGCSKAEKKEFTSHIPPETAEVGQDIQIDETNHIEITDINIKEFEDSKYVVITYDWTNDSKSAATSDKSFTITASQDDVGLKPNLKVVEDKKKLVTQIEGGETLSGMEQGFALRNEESPVILSIKGKMFSVFIDGKPQSAYPVKVTVELP
ncbi:MAG TPA: DUF5067 domain-containing protein [Clostridiaceae bacterium]|nr:DUF5067 domain-containing protein [Clostridiaceae bacterium]